MFIVDSQIHPWAGLGSSPDFTLTFGVTAGIAIAGALLVLPLPRNGGQVVTGHRPDGRR